MPWTTSNKWPKVPRNLNCKRNFAGQWWGHSLIFSLSTAYAMGPPYIFVSFYLCIVRESQLEEFTNGGNIYFNNLVAKLFKKLCVCFPTLYSFCWVTLIHFLNFCKSFLPDYRPASPQCRGYYSHIIEIHRYENSPVSSHLSRVLSLELSHSGPLQIG